MFTLDFKPQFYSYPLHTEQYARIKLRNQEIRNQIDKLQAELTSINAQPNSSQYLPYKSRIEDKISIFRQELREYAQVLECHEHIDVCLKNDRKNKSEFKHKLLEEYKAESIARKYRKASEKAKELQNQKQALRVNQSSILAQVSRAKAKRQLQKLFLDSNQDKHVYGKKYSQNISELTYASKRNDEIRYSNPEIAERSTRLTKIKLPKLAEPHSTMAQSSGNKSGIKNSMPNFVVNKL